MRITEIITLILRVLKELFAYGKKAENEKLKTELAESPAESPINTNKFSVDRKPLSTKEYKKLTRQERFLYNLNK